MHASLTSNASTWINMLFLCHSMKVLQDTFFKQTNMSVSWLSLTNAQSNKDRNVIFLIATTAISFVRVLITATLVYCTAHNANQISKQ